MTVLSQILGPSSPNATLDAEEAYATEQTWTQTKYNRFRATHNRAEQVRTVCPACYIIRV